MTRTRLPPPPRGQGGVRWPLSAATARSTLTGGSMTAVRTFLSAALIVAVGSFTLDAQKVVSTKKGGGGSPHETVEWSIDGAKITIAYGRPYLKGRPLEKLTPHGQVWRTGADEATTLTTDKQLMIGSLMIKPGSYTLYTCPERQRLEARRQQTDGPVGDRISRGSRSRTCGPQGREGREAGRTVHDLDHGHAGRRESEARMGRRARHDGLHGPLVRRRRT